MIRIILPIILFAFWNLSLASAAPSIRAHFSDPYGQRAAKNSLETLVVNFIDRAVPGSKIRINIYEFESSSVRAALKRAVSRSVDVQVVLDDKAIEDSDLRKARTKLINDIGVTRVFTCPGDACIGTGNNHNKFFLFSEVVDPRNSKLNIRYVILSSSYNLTSNQNSKFNNTIEISGDEALYSRFLKYWEDARNLRGTTDYLNGPNGMGDGASSLATRVYFSPSPNYDPILDLLKNVTSCANGGAIYMAYSLFKEPRAARVLDQLNYLFKNLGCKVAFIVRSEKDDNWYYNEMIRSGMDVYTFNWSHFGKGVHSKYMLVDAEMTIDGQKRRRKVVFTGSQNMESDSLELNDEVLLRIMRDDAYTQFLSDWRYMSSKANKVAP